MACSPSKPHRFRMWIASSFAAALAPARIDECASVSDPELNYKLPPSLTNKDMLLDFPITSIDRHLRLAGPWWRTW